MTPHPASPLGSTTLGLTWLDRIDMAVSVNEVLDIVRVYLAAVTPGEFALLPMRCRPRKLVDGDDLAEYALDLVRETCTDPAATPMVLKIAAIISHASNRTSELVTRTNDATAAR